MGQIAKQSIKGTIVTYLGVAIGFVTTFFVLTRFLTSEEIGLARVFIDAGTLFVGLAQLGTSSSIIRFFPYFKDKSATCHLQPATYHGFFLYAMLIPLLGFALFGLVYLACHAPLAAFFGDKSPLFVDYYYLVLPLAFFMLYQAVLETSANVLMHIVLPRFVREVVVRLCLLSTYLLYAFDILSMDGFVWAICASYALCALINAAYLIYLLYPSPINFQPNSTTLNFKLSTFNSNLAFLKANPQLVKSWFLYTAFLLVSAVTSVLAPTLSSFFITAQMGLSYTGIFAIATYMAVMVSIPSRSLVAITQPELSMAIKNNDTSNIQRLLNQASSNLLLVGGFILLVLWINIDLIFAVLPNGETYAVAKYVVLLLGVGQLMVTMFAIYFPALSYSRFYAFSLLNSLTLTVSALLLNNYLIPRYGMIGAAWATVLADVCYYFMVTLIVSLTLHVHPFSRRHLSIIALILTVFLINYLLSTLQLNGYFPLSTFHFQLIISNLVLIIAAFAAYKLELSPELNALLRQIRI